MTNPQEKTPPPAEATDESELVAKAIAGDVASLEALLVSRHEQLLHYIERSMPASLRAKVAAEDLLQQTYLQVFKAIGSFEPKGPGAFFAWLKTIASRKLIDATRSRGREQLVGQAPAGSGSQSSYQSLMVQLAQTGAGAGTLAMNDELRGAFHVALANLPESYREVVQMRYLDDLSLEAVAERLGVTTGAARGLCHRARQALRDEIVRLSRFI